MGQSLVLFVDDEKNMLRCVNRLTMEEEYELVTASSGDEGLGILEERPVKVVVSDYRMPGMNGVDFLKRVKEKWPFTIRIILSGFADVDTAMRAINEGEIYKFLPKPWDDDFLLVTIRRAIEKYDLVSENRKLTEELKALNAVLERKVEERTRDLTLQSEVLKLSQEILEDIPIAVIGVDPSGLIVLANRHGKKVLEVADKSEILGKHMKEFFPGDIEDKVVESIWEDKKVDDLVFKNCPFSCYPLSRGQKKRGVILFSKIPGERAVEGGTVLHQYHARSA